MRPVFRFGHVTLGIKPIYFSIYTNEITCKNDNIMLIIYAEDMALVAFIVTGHLFSILLIFSQPG